MSSPSPAFDVLPDVLAQLVMQSLQLRELVQFARCSRRLLTQADSAFAFKHVQPVTFRWSANGQRLFSKLLRRIPVKFRPNIDPDDRAAMDALLAQLDSFQLYELDTTELSLPLRQCVRLLEHSAMQSVQVLALEGNEEWASCAVLEAAARLPKLHSVLMLDTSEASLRPSVDSLCVLSASPSLTSLSIHDYTFRFESLVAALVGFPQLAHLTVKQPSIYDERWVAQFASPGLCNLISLTFDWCLFNGPLDGENPVQPEHADAVFTSLTQLTSLQIKMPFGVDVFLPSIRCAAALRSLRIEANCDPEDEYAPRVLPSFAVLHPLMIAKPVLRIELDLRDHTSPLRDEYLPSLAADFAGVSAEVRDRLTVLYEKPLWI